MSLLDGLAAEIASHGVRHVFGVPGSGATLTLIDALERRDVVFVRAQHEAASAIMAGALGCLTGKAGVALSIKGPGLANTVAGLAHCSLEAFPVVAVAEAYAPGSSPARAHKRMDHGRLVAAVAKGARCLAEAGPGFDALAAWAEREVPGPVLLELPDAAVAHEAAVPGAPAAPGRAGDALAERIAAARRPVVIAGTLAVRRRWRDALAALTVPVFTTAAAKGLIDETLPQAAGVYTGVGLARTPEHQLLPQADLVVGLGLRPAEVLAAGPLPCPALGIDALAPDLAAPFGFVDHGGNEAAPHAFEALAGKRWGLESLAATLAALRQALLAAPFLPAHVYESLAGRFASGARIVLDTGLFCTIGEHVWRSRRPDWILSAGQGRTMGTALPMALAASLHDGSLPTLAVLGDGGIGPYVGELHLAVERRLPLLVLLMTDGHLGSIRTRALRDGLSDAALRIHGPPWSRTIEGMGIASERIEKQSRLEDALKAWDPRSGPLFLEVAFDADPYQRMLEGIR